MTVLHDEVTVAALTSSWVQDMVKRCQVFAGEASYLSLRNLTSQVERFAREIPPPRNPAEYFVQRALLLEAALEVTAHVHRQTHGSYPHTCRFDGLSTIARLWSDRGRPPSELLIEWSQAAYTVFQPDEKFLTIQRWMAERLNDSLTLKTVAHEFGMPTRRLDRSFKNYSGISLAKYVHGLRVVKALQMLLLEGIKIEAISPAVGFDSRKNLYRAFRDWFGITPGKARRARLLESAATYERIPAVFRGDVDAILKAEAVKSRSA